MRLAPRLLAEASDAELIEKCLQGNEDGWAALIERYQQLIYSIPYRYGATSEEAADVFQAVCMDLLTELPKLRETVALRSWLATITAHRCFHWKRRRKRNEEPGSLEDLALEPVAEEGSAEEIIAQAESSQRVREALRALPGRCREMLRMLFFDDPPVPYKEVARRLSLAVGSIGFLRGRCLTKLRGRLEAREL